MSFSWGIESEKRFVDGLGTFSGSIKRKPEDVPVKEKIEWLREYIESHKRSEHEHHQVGVEYARGKLERLQERAGRGLGVVRGRR